MKGGVRMKRAHCQWGQLIEQDKGGVKIKKMNLNLFESV
jgi:hypothetical protein